MEVERWGLVANYPGPPIPRLHCPWKKDSVPLVLLLQQQHYTFLKPTTDEAEIKQSWLRSTVFGNPDDLRGAAKSISQGSDRTPSVHSIKLPQKRSGPISSCGTPSVHTLKSAPKPVHRAPGSDMPTQLAKVIKSGCSVKQQKCRKQDCPKEESLSTPVFPRSTVRGASEATPSVHTLKIVSKAKVLVSLTKAQRKRGVFAPTGASCSVKQNKSKQQKSSGSTLTECDFRPDTAPYPRQLKELDAATLAKPQGEQVWVCLLEGCGHQIKIQPGHNARAKLLTAK